MIAFDGSIPTAAPVAEPVPTPAPSDSEPVSGRVAKSEAPRVEKVILGVRVIVGEVVHEPVRVLRMSPLTYPDRHLAFVDADGEEILTVDHLSDLDDESQAAVTEALRERYMTATIERVVAVKNELGVSYFEVDTNRGRRSFVVQNLLEGARWLGDKRLLIFDVDGNRFEIPDLEALDRRSFRLLHTVI